jgi:hypothetical protein
MRVSKDLVDRILFAVGNCHDGSELWGHMRRDPEAFRRAVSYAIAPALMGSQAEAESWLVRIERLLTMGAFYEASELLRKLDVDQLGSATLVSLAAITFHAKDHLNSRLGFIERVELALTDRFGAERAASLLKERR